MKPRVALVGSTGRLGSVIRELFHREFEDKLSLTLEVQRGNAPKLVKGAGDLDVILDVSSPSATEQFLNDLLKQNTTPPYVIGSTGWTEAQMKTVNAYAQKAAVVFAPNFSLGVNVFLNLLEQAAPVLEKYGYSAIIHETHHTKKVDAPSGTAKAVVERLGNMKSQVHSSRAGNIIGTHEVQLVGTNDILTVTHEALDRSIFARGALVAAEWAANHRKAGFYSMKDVLFRT